VLVARTIRAFFERHFHCNHRQRFRAVSDAVTGLIRAGKASLTARGTRLVPAHRNACHEGPVTTHLRRGAFQIQGGEPTSSRPVPAVAQNGDQRPPVRFSSLRLRIWSSPWPASGPKNAGLRSTSRPTLCESVASCPSSDSGTSICAASLPGSLHSARFEAPSPPSQSQTSPLTDATAALRRTNCSASTVAIVLPDTAGCRWNEFWGSVRPDR
jgi:hypothetical protein